MPQFSGNCAMFPIEIDVEGILEEACQRDPLFKALIEARGENMRRELPKLIPALTEARKNETPLGSELYQKLENIYYPRAESPLETAVGDDTSDSSTMDTEQVIADIVEEECQKRPWLREMTEPELCSDPTVNSLRSSFQIDIFEPELDDKFRALRRVSPEMRAEMLNLERNCGIRRREGDVENSPEAQDKDADLLNALGQNAKQAFASHEHDRHTQAAFPCSDSTDSVDPMPARESAQEFTGDIDLSEFNLRSVRFSRWENGMMGIYEIIKNMMQGMNGKLFERRWNRLKTRFPETLEMAAGYGDENQSLTQEAFTTKVNIARIKDYFTDPILLEMLDMDEDDYDLIRMEEEPEAGNIRLEDDLPGSDDGAERAGKTKGKKRRFDDILDEERSEWSPSNKAGKGKARKKADAKAKKTPKAKRERRLNFQLRFPSAPNAGPAESCD